MSCLDLDSLSEEDYLLDNLLDFDFSDEQLSVETSDSQLTHLSSGPTSPSKQEYPQNNAYCPSVMSY